MWIHGPVLYATASSMVLYGYVWSCMSLFDLHSYARYMLVFLICSSTKYTGYHINKGTNEKNPKILNLAKKEPSLAHAIISMNVSLVRLYLRIIFPPIVLRNPIKINHLLPTSQPEPQIQL